MLCVCCKRQDAAVCTRCIQKNVEAFHQDKLGPLTQKNHQKTGRITVHLKNRLPSSKETAIAVQNIRRETVYTRELVVIQEARLDELRDRVARRRQLLDEARKALHTNRTETINALKTHNKVKRKLWKATYEATIMERRKIVCNAISIHRLRPISPRRNDAGCDSGAYEIGGLSLPSLFRLREYSSEHVTQVFHNLAQITLHLSHYLGIVPPHEICTVTRHSFSIGIRTPTDIVHLSALSDNHSSFAKALACLAIDIQYLCRTQGSLADPKEDDLGRLIFALLASPTLAHHSTDVAYSTAQDKEKIIRDNRREKWDMTTLGDRIYDDLTEQFEIIEKQQPLAHSTMSQSNYQFVNH